MKITVITVPYQISLKFRPAWFFTSLRFTKIADVLTETLAIFNSQSNRSKGKKKPWGFHQSYQFSHGKTIFEYNLKNFYNSMNLLGSWLVIITWQGYSEPLSESTLKANRMPESTDFHRVDAKHGNERIFTRTQSSARLNPGCPRARQFNQTDAKKQNVKRKLSKLWKEKIIPAGFHKIEKEKPAGSTLDNMMIGKEITFS